MRDGVVNRIKQVMDYYQMSASVFSGEIGVQRSSISHILSGRNNPSLDMVQRILEKFTNVNSEWMLFGKGNMFSDKSPVSLFDSIDDSNEQKKLAIPKQDQTTPQKNGLATGTLNKEIDKPHKQLKQQEEVNNGISSEKEIDKIVFFYKDGSFKIYKPED